MATTRILIVDDSDQWRIVVRSILERAPSLRVVGEAVDGLDAIEKIGTLLPDVVLLDLGMPGLNGIGVAKIISQSFPESKIIFLTQERDDEVKKAALAVGGFAYVLKSRAGSELLATIESARLAAVQTAALKLSVPELPSSV